MPLDRTTAWGAALVGDARPTRPSAPGQIFLTTSALHDVTVQVARDGPESVGFFAGECFRDAESMEPWMLVGGVIPVAKQATRIPIGLLLDATIELARARADAAGQRVVGWYRSVECGRPVLTAIDTETHERHFGKAHAFLLMIAVGRAERQAAFFRPTLDRSTLVPFYELLEPEVALAWGAKPTAVGWSNYFTVDTVFREEPRGPSDALWHPVAPPPPVPAAAMGPQPGPVLEPQEPEPLVASAPFEMPHTPLRIVGSPKMESAPTPSQVVAAPPGKAAVSDDAIPAPAPRAIIMPDDAPPLARSPLPATTGAAPFRIIDPALFDREEQAWWPVRIRPKPVLYGGVAVATVAAIVAVATGNAPALWPEHHPTPPAAAPATVLSAADAAGEVVARYRAVARELALGRGACAQLVDVLTSLDEAWIKYFSQRSALAAPLDQASLEREATLQSEVAWVEQHFRSSGCSRPSSGARAP